MKKLLLSVLTIALLNSTLLAKEPTSKYHVEVVKVKKIENQSNKKTIGGKTLKTVVIKLWKKTGDSIKKIFIKITTDITVNQLEKEVSKYVNTYGLNEEKIALKFNGKVKVSILKDFSPKKYQYNKFENVSVDYTLDQKSYSYLLSIEQDEACLLYPNTTAKSSLQNRGAYSLGGFAFDKRGDVKLYFISSLDTIDFSDFEPKGIYRCTTRGKGLQKISNIKNQYFNDVLRQDIFIK